MPLARNAELFLVGGILSVASAYHLLNLSCGTCAIVDENGFPRMKHSHTGLSGQDRLRVTASDQTQA
jgi:hypothetical protein